MVRLEFPLNESLQIEEANNSKVRECYKHQVRKGCFSTVYLQPVPALNGCRVEIGLTAINPKI